MLPRSEPQQRPRIPFRQVVEFLNRLTEMIALTVMVFLRRDIGHRLLSPLHAMIAFAILAIFGAMLEEHHPDSGMGGLYCFAALSLVLMAGQRAKRMRDFRNGLAHHSYYIGTSPFDFHWLPYWIRRERRVARKIDPLFCFCVGAAFLPLSLSLGIWIIVAGLCLHGYEQTVFLRDLNTKMDMIDNLIVSSVYGDEMAQFTQPPSPARQRPASQKNRPNAPKNGLPTGLGEDIQKWPNPSKFPGNN